MKTGAIQAGIGRVVQRLRGRELRMIPILMVLFALGGTTYGMAEESLAFYLLIVTVMIAAGYDALTGAALILLGCGIGVIGSTINPFATGIASGFAGVSISDGLIGRIVILVVGTAIGIWYVMRYAAARQERSGARRWSPSNARPTSRHFNADAMNTAAAEPMTGRQKVGAGRLLPRLRGDDRRRHPVGRPRHLPDPDALLVVPGDDRLVPVVRDRHRLRRAA